MLKQTEQIYSLFIFAALIISCKKKLFGMAIKSCGPCSYFVEIENTIDSIAMCLKSRILWDENFDRKNEA